MPNLAVINGSINQLKPFRENPLAIHLWKAVYPRPALSYDEIADRMSASYGERISHHVVNNILYHVRHHAEEYGWTIPHVQKGPDAEHRKYFPVLNDASGHPMRVADFADCLRAGGISSSRTILTMASHEAVAIDMAANYPSLSRVDRRKLRAAAAMFTAASEMASRVLSEVA